MPLVGTFILGVIVFPAVWFSTGRGGVLLAGGRPGRFGRGPSGYPSFGSGFGPWAIAGGVIHLIFWAILLVFFIWLLSRVSSRGFGAPRYPDTPLDILKRRYAAGDIDAETYAHMRGELQAGQG
ncbi:MAG TPA: hypothetical protein VKU60_18200 [Chloroflexota bacterium]|nr:hypothetical protein [Chloroflexota bacterium]